MPSRSLVGWSSALAGIVITAFALGRPPAPTPVPASVEPQIQIVQQPTEVKAARLGLVAAVLAALVAAVVSLGVALYSASAQSEQAKSGFLRDQRQAAYASLITDHQAFADAESAFYNAITLTNPGRDDYSGDLAKARTRFKDSLALVQLIGSADASTAASKLGNAHTTWSNDNITYIGTLPPTTSEAVAASPAGQEAIAKARAVLADDELAESELLSAFMRQARLDLGAEPS